MKKILICLSLITYHLSLINPIFAVGPGPAGRVELTQLITRIINISVEAAFLLLLIMLIFAGFKFLTSGGDPKAISSASSTITWALLGILFLAIGWLLLLLIRNLTGVDVTQFCIGFADVCH